MTMTRQEMDAIPERQTFRTVINPVTGIASHERLEQQFMVSKSDVLFYTDPFDGSRWRLVEDRDGKTWKERW